MATKDGRRIKSGSPIDAIAPFIMPHRNGASNLFSATIDIDKCEKLLREQRLEGLKGIGMIHIFMAAYVRMIAQYPGINRFLRGQRVYSRNGIEICMAIKKELKLNATETIVKVYTNPEDTLTGIYKKLTKEIDENTHDGDQNDMDTAARVLAYIPGVVLKFLVWLLKLVDYFGGLPRWLTKLSPFHGSIFITNMGSLGMPPIFHHLYDFGNLPVFVSMGAKRTEYSINKQGEPIKRRLLDFTFVCDERICDGHYYASGFKYFKKLLENPEILLAPPKEVAEDID